MTTTHDDLRAHAFELIEWLKDEDLPGYAGVVRGLLAALDAERQRAEALADEIATAREACPSVRMQDNFDAPLLVLINKEVSRGFN